MRIFKPYPVLRESLVNLKSGIVFRGVIWKDSRGFLILRNALLIQDQNRQKADPRAVDGEILIYKSEVDFLQLL